MINIETKIVRWGVDDYKKFGWEITGTNETRHMRGRHSTDYILSRDKTMPNYRLLAALEKKYFALKSELKEYDPMDPGFAIIAFLLFIVPFIIYLTVKTIQKSRIEKHNYEIQTEMNEVVKEAAKLL